MSDHHLPLSRLLDSPPLREKRIDPKDGNSYTREEFLVYYGLREGQERWYQAVVDEVEMACAQVAPFEGERYSLAFYPMKPDEGERLDEDEHEEIRKSVKSDLAIHLHDAKSNYAGTGSTTVSSSLLLNRYGLWGDCSLFSPFL